MLERPAGHSTPVRLGRETRQRSGRAAGQPAEEHRLAHRLGVLELVAHHQLVQLARALVRSRTRSVRSRTSSR